MNFGRVVRMAIRYKFTFAASLFTALMVALFWVANIGTIYPVVEVIFEDKSMQQWIDMKIAQNQALIAEKSAAAEKLRRQLAALGAAGDSTQRRLLQSNLANVETELTSAQASLRGSEIAKPYIDAYLPNSPFQTLLIITGLLVVGTVIKDVFLVLNGVLVARLAQLATFDLRKLFYRRTLKMDLATFTEDGTADLMSRFTNDMNQAASGVESLFGRLVRRAAEDVRLSGRGGLYLLAAAAADDDYRPDRRVFDPLAGQNAQAGQSPGDGGNGHDLRHPRRDLPQHQDRQGLHQRAPRAEPLPRRQQTLLPQGHAHRPLQFAQPPADRSAGHRHHLGGHDGRGLADPLPRDAPVRHPHERHAAEPRRDAHRSSSCWPAWPIRCGRCPSIFSNLQAGSAAADRIFSRLDRQPQVREPIHPVAVQRHHRDLTFENVGFAYQPGNPVLNEVNLQIAFGETVAIVGPNGCGKSTLANLIPRFADPTSGVVRLDGVALTDMRLRDLRGQIGLVTQETMLFDDTIFNNIRYGAYDATHEQVIEAARQAHAHRFIETELPDGYDTSAGALGNRLSGGQRQRIALARAILRDPAILILDEATSQVDLESEQAIQQVLEKFTRGRTTVLITHRLSVLSLADRIVVMEGGRILDVGSHQELLARCNLYRRLYQIHFEDLKQTA